MAQAMYKVWGDENILSFNKLVEYLVSKHGYNKEDATRCVQIAHKTGFSSFKQVKPVPKDVKIFKLHC